MATPWLTVAWAVEQIQIRWTVEAHVVAQEREIDMVCVLLLQDLLQSCARGGRRRVEDMCYERRRADGVLVYYCSVCVFYYCRTKLKLDLEDGVN